MTTFMSASLPISAAAQQDTPDPDEAARSVASEDSEDLPGFPSIAEELAKGIDLLDQEIAKQQQELPNAQGDRERQLIQDHVTFLKEERQSLSRLLNMLVGPHFDAREAARESQQEREYEREQKTLERRTPQ